MPGYVGSGGDYDSDDKGADRGRTVCAMVFTALLAIGIVSVILVYVLLPEDKDKEKEDARRILRQLAESVFGFPVDTSTVLDDSK